MRRSFCVSTSEELTNADGAVCCTAVEIRYITCHVVCTCQLCGANAASARCNTTAFSTFYSFHRVEIVGASPTGRCDWQRMTLKIIKPVTEEKR